MYQNTAESAMVSVIIPVYNVQMYLAECVDSVINQTYKNLEIILVDDGSTDESGKICDQYSEIDSRIHVIHKKNGGLSDARNVGLDYAVGEYIFFVDSDDFIARGTIKSLFDRLVQTNTDMAMCNIQYVDEHGKAMSKQDFFRDFQIKNNVWTQEQFWNCCYRRGHIVCTVQWNKLYVKKIFENLRYPNGKVREDEFMIHHIINRCNRIACVNKKMYYYRQHTGSIMGNAYSINQLDIIEAYIERERSFRKKGKFLLAEKTLIRAILFLEWFEIGMKHAPQIDERYLNMKKIVCRECKIIIRSQSTVCFRLLFWMYSKNMLPYKPLRAIYWNVNRIKRKTALLILEKNISKVEKKQKKN